MSNNQNPNTQCDSNLEVRKIIMALNYENLDETTRLHMLSEVKLDISRDNIYMSPRLNEDGEVNFVSLLKEAIKHHDDAWLAQQLRNQNYMKEYEQRRKRVGDGTTNARVPVNAPDMLSEGEFNRYYVRGLCIRVIEENMDDVEVYRGKEVSRPRPESQAKIGKKFAAKTLLEDLRESVGVDTVLGLPAGPNSGLTIRLVKNS